MRHYFDADKWEYPWYAAWDLAFHCVTLADIDPVFAKNQLLLMTRVWVHAPEWQIPAYEWAFGGRESAGTCMGCVGSVQGRMRCKRWLW